MDVSGGKLTLPELLDAFGKIAWLEYIFQFKTESDY